jgi:NADH:ubiquinone oxidoreductase subunit F (NADH-binding)
LTLARRPAIVHNVETLANLALIARHGSVWFRRLGVSAAPGTRLVTISGSVQRPGVVEVVTGTAIAEILELARPLGPLQAVLVGGYGGSWIPRSDISTPYAPQELHEIGASMGAGVLVALGTSSCGIAETARIACFMATESAGQCGPCLFGLPAIAEDLQTIVHGEGDRRTLDRLLSRCGFIAGRGACRLPDGVVRLVQSALRVFSADLEAHLGGLGCAADVRPRTGRGGKRP